MRILRKNFECALILMAIVLFFSSASFYPAMFDFTAYLQGRAGGWPHFFANGSNNDPDIFKSLSYFDVVNFARFLKPPGFYSWGYNDNIVSSSSSYTAYNAINAPKILHLVPDTRHYRYPEQQELCNKWMYEKLKIKYEN